MAVALDSNAIIGFLDRGDALHTAATEAIRRRLRTQPLVASAVTYAEVLTGARLGRHNASEVESFFSDLISAILPVETDVARTAAGLRAIHKSLRMPDALILASAELHPEVEVVVSGDGAYDKVSGLSFRVELLR